MSLGTDILITLTSPLAGQTFFQGYSGVCAGDARGEGPDGVGRAPEVRRLQWDSKMKLIEIQ